MRRISDFFFAEESPAQRKPAVIFLYFFPQIFGTIQRLEICPDMWENVQPEVSEGKFSHGWRYLKVLEFLLNWHSPSRSIRLRLTRRRCYTPDLQQRWRCLFCSAPIFCRHQDSFSTPTNTFHLHLCRPSSSSASFSLCPSSHRQPGALTAAKVGL